MMYEPFATRVAALRDGWLARRHMKHLNIRRDREARLGLLLALYDWAEDSLDTIADVYEGTIRLALTPRPDAEDDLLSFSIAVEDEYRIGFWIAPKSQQRGDQWDLHAEMRTPMGVSSVAPSRGAGQWTQARVEELLLSLLAAVEREHYEAQRSPRRRPMAG